MEQLKENLICLLGSVERPSTSEHELTLDEVLQSPERLVGERISHRFEVNGELIWYEGTVQRYNFNSKEFQIAYDGEEDLCLFPLMDDIATGDLVIIH